MLDGNYRRKYMQGDNVQNLEIRYIKEGIIEIKEFLKTFESKNCIKHQEILATTNQAIGKMGEKIEEVEKRKLEKDWFNKFLESNNGKLEMIDGRISKNERKIGWAVWVLTAIIGLATFLGNRILDLFVGKN
jgi:hypothetical protein